MIFLINVPVGILDIFARLRAAQGDADQVRRRSWTSRGFALATLAFPSLLLGFSRGA